MTQSAEAQAHDREDEPQRADVPERLAREADDEVEGVVEELREVVVRRPGVPRLVAHLAPSRCALRSTRAAR